VGEGRNTPRWQLAGVGPVYRRIAKGAASTQSRKEATNSRKALGYFLTFPKATVAAIRGPRKEAQALI
jgi:hypothetical protein